MPADGSTHPLEGVIITPELRPYFDREVVKEREWLAANAGLGVSFSGLSDVSRQPRTVGEVYRDAETAMRRDAERANSPRRTFLVALKGVAEFPTYEADAERLRALYSRDLADARKPLNVAAVGAALLILNEIPGKDARRAIDALSELLLQTRKEAA